MGGRAICIKGGRGVIKCIEHVFLCECECVCVCGVLCRVASCH